MKKKYQEAVSASKTYSRSQTTHAITFDDLSDPLLLAAYAAHRVCGFTLGKAAKLNTPNLSPSQKLVLSTICDFASHQAVSNLAISKTLEQYTGLSRRTIGSAISKLREHQYITDIKFQGKWCSYLINAPLLLGFQIPSAAQILRSKTTPAAQPLRTINKNTPTQPSQTTDTPFIDDSFVSDWDDCINDITSSLPPPSTPNHSTSNTYTFDPDTQSLPFLPPPFDIPQPFLLQSLPVRFYRTVDKTTP